MLISIFLLFILLKFSVHSQEVLKENQTKKVTLYWDFNKTQVQSTGHYYKDELGETTDKHGKWLYFDRLGNLQEERNFYKDMLHGKVLAYHAKDKLKQEGYFYLNRQDSIYREWHENGKLSIEGVYKMNDPIGMWKYFYFDGREKAIEETRAGEVFVWNFWLSDPLHTQTVENGNGEMTTYYPTGQVKEWYNYKDGLRNGDFEELSIMGYPLLQGSFNNGVKDGTWTYAYYTGQVEKITNYSNGNLTGPY
jgi:antitoxin component YwqK of YwqJK toxin-antitoxin module